MGLSGVWGVDPTTEKKKQIIKKEVEPKTYDKSALSSANSKSDIPIKNKITNSRQKYVSNTPQKSISMNKNKSASKKQVMSNSKTYTSSKCSEF